MAVTFKCKMCGGDLAIEEGSAIGKCLYCGSTMTVPQIASDRKTRLFNKANEYRLNAEYDKSYAAYKAIAEEDETEAEAYWGMILSDYGIEYVEDPSNHKRVPTCHRTKTQSIQSSVDFKNAIKYADAERRMLYQDEAQVLDRLQREILAVSSKEDPYDVFICYKETDDLSNERTEDSVIAQNIYETLTEKGIRTFFAKVSLQNHLGENYEPYIFSALSTARVMLHVSTKGEHSDAVWVKNEWSRFISLMQTQKEKIFIPVYKDMSPYQFPEEMSKFQAQDISRVGALQDLVSAIQKLLGKATTETGNQILNDLLADKLKREEGFRKRKNTLKRVVTTAAIVGIVVAIVTGSYSFVISPLKEKKQLYEKGIAYYERGNYHGAEKLLKSIDGTYKDSEYWIAKCELMTLSRRNRFQETYFKRAVSRLDYEKLNEDQKEDLHNMFKEMLLRTIRIRGEENFSNELVSLFGDSFGNEELWKSISAWATAEAKYSNGEYSDAISELIELGNKDPNVPKGFMDSFIKLVNEDFSKAKQQWLEEAKGTDSDGLVMKIYEFSDVLSKNNLLSSDNKDDIRDVICSGLKNSIEGENYKYATKLLTKISDLGDTRTLETCQDVLYAAANDLFDKKEYENAIAFYNTLGDYKDASDLALESTYLFASEKEKDGEELKAIDLYGSISNYKDANELALDLKYQYCKNNIEKPTSSVLDFLDELVKENYKDASELKKIATEWHAKVSADVNLSMGNMREILISADLTGGPKNGKTKVNFKVKLGSENFSYTPDESFKDGDTANSVLSDYSDTDIFNMPLAVTVYDGAGNVIGMEKFDHVESSY